MTGNPETAGSPVSYTVQCKAVHQDGRACVLINEGGVSDAYGYSIWSKADLDRVVSQLIAAGAAAWPEEKSDV